MEDIRDIRYSKKITALYILSSTIVILIILKLFFIQFIISDDIKSKIKEKKVRDYPIEARRGNIYADNGKDFLATSIPLFEIRFNFLNLKLDKKNFSKEAKLLADSLALIIQTKPSEYYYKRLMNGFNNNNKNSYYLLERNVHFYKMRSIAKLTFFKTQGCRGTLVREEIKKRKMPYGLLAKRTIGFIVDNKKNKNYVGIEGAYDSLLKGENGKRAEKLITGGEWIPVKKENLKEPKDGADIITTLNINFQDIVESELEAGLRLHNADNGCAILMEVNTGEIKAIANLKKDSSQSGLHYFEASNYAIGSLDADDPGSVFKLLSMLLILEKGKYDTNTTINIGNGKKEYCNGKYIMKDSHPPKTSIITAKQAFIESSNVGISLMAYNSFAGNPQEFIDGLYKLGLNKTLGIDIKGEKKPFVRNTNDKLWSCLSLPLMSVGYELTVSPLQILNIYNTVANNGVMVKPHLVSRIIYNDNRIDTIKPKILKNAICSQTTIKKLKRMLEEVVEKGTAKSAFKGCTYKVAGKTGTAQRSYANRSGRMSYKSTFMGYFPSDKPKYSLIVVVINPSMGSYYGGAVSGPIFRGISDRIWGICNINKTEPVLSKIDKKNIKTQYACYNKKDLLNIKQFFGFNLELDAYKSEWLNIKLDSVIKINGEKQFTNGQVPDVTGMPLKDAVYILENKGLKVSIAGKGRVRNQSIKPGTKLEKAQTIKLDLL
ncbi:MAG: transpeptidase family protein [Bacteroidales bacterium]|nr:transpeptidase family protein [Bacteroidales bacterium]